jgi:hypothetical protein
MSSTTTPAGAPIGVAPPIDLPAHEAAARAVCPEEVARVVDTAADLVVQGRRVTPRLLAALTGIEPAGVDAALGELVRRGLLRPAGQAPHHYVFAPGRWPATA